MDIREKLVELMIEAKKADTEDAPFSEFLADFMIAHGVTIQQWIPVSERLPSDERDVLVYYGFGDLRFMHMATLSYYCFDPNPHWQHEGTGMKITHWMPLPTPPKGVSEDEV